MNEAAPAGAILAGGRSRRMEGQPKALLPLAGKPMLQHVIDRVKPQVSRLVLVLERHNEIYDRFGLDSVEDPAPGGHGPLAGLLSAMRSVSGTHDWLLLAPCDAPFLPLNLGKLLLGCCASQSAEVALVRQGQQWQPTFSLWQTSLLPQLERAVEIKHIGGLQRFLREIHPALLDWPPKEGSINGSDPFFNVNDAAALEEARLMMEAGAIDSC